MKRESVSHPTVSMPVKVGDLVTVDLGGRSFRGSVVEDRGPIGVGGRRLYGVLEIDAEPTSLELPAEDLDDVTSSKSERYTRDLYEEIVAAAKRSNAEIIVSYSGDGDVQIRGRSMLPKIKRRSEIFQRIDEMLVEEANFASGRIAASSNNPPGGRSNQHWFFVRG